MMQQNTTQIIPIFDGKNFSLWIKRMKAVLKSRSLWTIVQEGIPETPQISEIPTKEELKSQKEWEELEVKDQLALQLIHSALSEEILGGRVSDEESSKAAWDLLHTEFKGDPKTSQIRLQRLRANFWSVKQTAKETIKEFMKRVIELNNEMKSYGDNMPEQYLVSKVLSSLTTKYDPYVGVIEQTKDLEKLTLQELLNALQMQENRLEDRDEHNTEEEAFYARFSKLSQRNQSFEESDDQERKSRWCNYCKKDNHDEAFCYFKNKKTNDDHNRVQQRSQIECFKCGELGHIARDCKKKRTEQAYMHQEETKMEELLFSASHIPALQTTWFLDSGATNHMAKEESMFTDLDKSIQTPIKMANGEKIMSIGTGNIIVETSLGQLTICDVFLVPKITRNLLSVGQLVRSGYKVLFDERKSIILDKDYKKLIEVSMIGNTFSFKWSVVEKDYSVQERNRETFNYNTSSKLLETCYERVLKDNYSSQKGRTTVSTTTSQEKESKASQFQNKSWAESKEPKEKKTEKPQIKKTEKEKPNHQNKKENPGKEKLQVKSVVEDSKREQVILPIHCEQIVKKPFTKQRERAEKHNSSEIVAHKHDSSKIDKQIRSEKFEERISKGEGSITLNKTENEKSTLPWSFVDVVKGICPTRDNQIVSGLKSLNQNLGFKVLDSRGSVGNSSKFDPVRNEKNQSQNHNGRNPQKEKTSTKEMKQEKGKEREEKDYSAIRKLGIMF